ncbi:hypothetical protein [Mycolicibacterium sp. CBMA 226]|uniref:hypothetical protein n=1 Tax=Mycolicibacterium sp. CBMA 226 TaxID=2606611 RepID=UPI0012DE03A3|nr:hypothetical protein [Mycolicibacterium sp. CBMA 226]MUL78898.1 hypothetical protein [Mycolicibacterium sp. CBMA 226]QGW61197.1 hypothetical protein ICEMyc226_00165 [Mycolicibacterium sp.]
MKARVYDDVVLTVDVPGNSGDRIIPKGTRGAVIEAFNQPTERYAVIVNIPDDSSLSGSRRDNVILYPDQFDVAPTD